MFRTRLIAFLYQRYSLFLHFLYIWISPPTTSSQFLNRKLLELTYLCLFILSLFSPSSRSSFAWITVTYQSLLSLGLLPCILHPQTKLTFLNWNLNISLSFEKPPKVSQWATIKYRLLYTAPQAPPDLTLACLFSSISCYFPSQTVLHLTPVSFCIMLCYFALQVSTFALGLSIWDSFMGPMLCAKSQLKCLFNSKANLSASLCAPLTPKYCHHPGSFITQNVMAWMGSN